MSRTDHICLMATYNKWMNAKIYGAARCLSDDELSADRKAFFKSILAKPDRGMFAYCGVINSFSDVQHVLLEILANLSLIAADASDIGHRA